MKKSFLSFAVMMMALMSFTACSSEEDGPEQVSLEKRTYTVKYNFDDSGDSDHMESSMNVTFLDASNGIVSFQGATHLLDVWDFEGDRVSKFIYTYDGKEGTITMHQTITTINGKKHMYQDVNETKTFTLSADGAQMHMESDVLNLSEYNPPVWPGE